MGAGVVAGGLWRLLTTCVAMLVVFVMFVLVLPLFLSVRVCGLMLNLKNDHSGVQMR